VLVENYISPGAGLKSLNEVLNDSDMLFDTLFMDTDKLVSSNTPIAGEVVGPMARTYGSDASV
jgi:hypothetical protein